MTEKDKEDFLIDLTQPEGDKEGISSLYRTCADLYAKGDLVDCTLTCIDGHLQAHRIVLASVSSYLCNLLTSTPLPTPCSHPMLFLRNSTRNDVLSAMDYIYTGKTQTSKNKLLALLNISQELGCNSLRKAVEAAMQNYGIYPTPNQNGNNASTSGRSSSSGFNFEEHESEGEINTEDEGQQISVKQEIMTCGNGDDTENVNYLITECHQETSTNHKQKPMTRVNKRPLPTRLTSTVPNNYKLPRLDLPKNYEEGNSLRRNEVFVKNVSKIPSNSFNLNQQKSESFVYTNEDFRLNHGMGQEDDENELGADAESHGLNVNQPIMNNFNLEELIKGGFKFENDGRPVTCPLCLKVCTSGDLLEKHMRTHANNYRPFSCTFCAATFGRSAHLKRHLRVHTGEKPYVCTICQRAFARQDKLKGHLDRHVQNAVKSNSNAMSITSYPPVSMSQSSGGQVPIKVILPTARSTNGPATIGNNNFRSHSLNSNISSSLLNGNSNTNGLSISLANSSAPERSRSVSEGLIVTSANIPNSTTITPVTNGGGNLIDGHKPKKSSTMTRNFLVT